MDDESRKSLSDNQMLFALITALVKRTDGEIVITEAELDSVTKKDIVALYFNEDTRDIILSSSIKPSEDDGIYN